MMRLKASIAFWQIIACVIGIAACAFPCATVHRPFWAFGFAAHGSGGVRVEKIQPDTPAAALQEKDRILAVNGRRVVLSKQIDEVWRTAPVGSEVEFRVMRRTDPASEEAKEVMVRIPREADPVGAQLYWPWQYLAVIVLLGLGALVVASRTRVRLAPWRGAIVALVSMSLVVFILAVEWEGTWWPLRWQLRLWQKIAIGSGTDYVESSWKMVTTVVAALVLVLLGAADLRGVFSNGMRRPRNIAIALGALLLVSIGEGALWYCLTRPGSSHGGGPPAPREPTWSFALGVRVYLMPVATDAGAARRPGDEVWDGLLQAIAADAESKKLLSRLYGNNSVEFLPLAAEENPTVRKPSAEFDVVVRVNAERKEDMWSNRKGHVYGVAGCGRVSTIAFEPFEPEPDDFEILLLVVNDYLLRKQPGWQLFNHGFSADAIQVPTGAPAELRVALDWRIEDYFKRHNLSAEAGKKE